MPIIFKKTPLLTDAILHYCPGCTHGIIQRLVAETIQEMGIADRVIGVASVGCGTMIYEYIDCDFVQAAHGRAPAVATGVKRSRSDAVVFTYQGDGDLAAIGTAETIHAAARGENITVIFVNNAIYGMTGGQMAPTTMPGQITQTSPNGRDIGTTGFPVRVCELLATIDGVSYIERVSVDSAKNVHVAKKAIQRAFRRQIVCGGFSLVEVLSTCPTNWGMEPIQALEWLRDKMIRYYPLGVYKDKISSDEG
ncbi:MAG: thiamine pyrophosphate-dependent enzyme [Oscillospiraceae bacterium]|nr:thiamine pyrophosphate-dependent enzyme [Oscillospiraceae bacterium]